MSQRLHKERFSADMDAITDDGDIVNFVPRLSPVSVRGMHIISRPNGPYVAGKIVYDREDRLIALYT